MVALPEVERYPYGNRLAFNRTLLLLSCYVTGSVSLALALYNLLVGSDPNGTLRILQCGTTAICSLVALGLALRNRLQAGFWVLFIALLLGLSVAPFIYGLGARAPGLAVFTVVITMALFVINRRSAGLLTALCSLLAIASYLLERAGVLPGMNADNMPGPINSLILLLGCYLGAYAVGRAYSRQYEDMLKLAEEASVAKSRFLAMMSHEIRTPMNGVYAAAQLLQDPRLPEAKRARLLGTVKQSTEALLHLLNDILDTSRVEAGELQLINKPFCMGDLLNETLTLFEAAAQQKGLTLSGELDCAPQTLLSGDSARIRQMLSNLIGNAVKFTERGTVAVSMACEPTPTAGMIRLRCNVSDTGRGIAACDLQRLFRPFSQLDGEGQAQTGTGLGLALVKNIANLMSGDAGACSEPGKGSVFWFHVEVHAVAAR